MLLFLSKLLQPNEQTNLYIGLKILFSFDKLLSNLFSTRRKGEKGNSTLLGEKAFDVRALGAVADPKYRRRAGDDLSILQVTF